MDKIDITFNVFTDTPEGKDPESIGIKDMNRQLNPIELPKLIGIYV